MAQELRREIRSTLTTCMKFLAPTVSAAVPIVLVANPVGQLHAISARSRQSKTESVMTAMDESSTALHDVDDPVRHLGTALLPMHFCR